MKKMLINTICDIMSENKEVYMFTADLGYGVMDRLQEEYPDRFINVGICEQNMTSMAAGMALEGNIVFTYSIGNFPTLRCIEQIRNDVAYHRANVKIVAVGAGFSYGNLGMTHHATEDIAMMRAIPGMVIFSPADRAETKEAVKAAVKINGPVYIRLGRGGEEDINHMELKVNKVMCVKEGMISNGKPKVAILGTGTVMSELEKAANVLQNEFDVAAYSVAQLKPIDVEGIIELCQEADYVVTVEEHNIVGGLGSALAEILAEDTCDCKLIRIGMNDSFTQVVGSPSYLRQYYGLDCDGICRRIRQRISHR